MSRRRAALLAALFAVAATVSASSLDPQLRAVEQIRGRRFLHDVDVVTIDRAELPKRIREQMEKSLAYSVDDWIVMLRALQLVPAETKDPLPKLIDLYQSQVLAFYDPLSHTYYAIKQMPSGLPDVAPVSKEMLDDGVVVHELTHALQDQLFQAGARDYAIRDDVDAGLAYHALLEGEASLVMLADMMKKSGVDFDAIAKNELMANAFISAASAADKSMGDDAPRYFVESLKFPYLDGLQFCLAAYRRGGWAELDKVHANPPRSTREILHPEEYFAHTFTAAKFDPAPRNTGKAHVLSVEHLGEFHWGFLVGKANAVGWTDDRVTIVQDERCNPTVMVETKWESPERAKAFRTAYVAFLEGRNIVPDVSGDATTVKVTYTP